MSDKTNQADEKILDFMGQLIDRNGINTCYFAEPSQPPVDALCPGRARLFTVMEGCRETLISLNNNVTRLSLKPGKLLFAGTHTWHKPLSTSSYSLFTIIFDKDYTSYNIKSFDNQQQSHQHSWLYAPPILSGSIYHLIKVMENLDYTSRFSNLGTDLSRILFKMLYEYASTSDWNQDKSYETWQSLRDFMQENFHQPISRKTVAEQFQLHPNHISRLFQKYGSTSFVEYLNSLRMEHALFLLDSERKLTIQQISSLCGFQSSNYFSKAFKRRFGKSPRRNT